MRYPTHIYARALAEAITVPGAHAAEIAQNFMALLRKNGDEVHARKIFEEAARFARRKKGIHKVTVGSARPLMKKQIRALSPLISPSDAVEERINVDLVAGIRLFVDDEMRFDGSLKGKLDKMFGGV